MKSYQHLKIFSKVFSSSVRLFYKYKHKGFEKANCRYIYLLSVPLIMFFLLAWPSQDVFLLSNIPWIGQGSSILHVLFSMIIRWPTILRFFVAPQIMFVSSKKSQLFINRNVFLWFNGLGLAKLKLGKMRHVAPKLIRKVKGATDAAAAVKIEDTFTKRRKYCVFCL